MQTLALSGGDLVVSAGGYQVFTGAPKIRQDLSLAIIEPYGDDPYNPTFGSLLSRYVGQPLDSNMQIIVEQEGARVVQQYINMQQAVIATAQTQGKTVAYTTADVVVDITSVTATINLDTLQLSISVVTAAGQGVTINRNVSL